MTHAYVIEMVQAGTALLGIIFSCWATYDAMKDKGAIDRAQINGGKSLIAKGHIRSEIKNVLVFTLYLVAGITGLLLPPPFTIEQVVAIRGALAQLAEFKELQLALQAEREVGFASNVVRGVLTAATVLKVIDTLWERHDRRRFLRYLRSGEPKRRASDNFTNKKDDDIG